MDGNGMTGFDPKLARKNIDDFCDAAKGSAELLKTAFNNLFNGLKDNWGSPKARDFSDKYTIEIETLMHTLSRHVYLIADGAKNAYNAAASANGADPITGDVDIDVASSYVLPCELVDNLNGNVGMKITNVETILGEFETNMNSVNESFDKIPSSIALYDDANGQQQAYYTRVYAFKNEFENMATNIKNDIEGAADNNIEEVEQGVKAATEALMGDAAASAVSGAMSGIIGGIGLNK